MPTLIGPCQSEEARGTLAGLLTYSRRRGRALAGVASSPRQPRTIPQVATRIFMTWLTKEWARCSPAEKATWLNYAPTPLLSPYHAYLQHNINKFKNLPDTNSNLELKETFPSAAYPATKATPYENCSSTVAIGGKGLMIHNYWTANGQDGWFTSYHLKQPPIDFSTYANIVHIENNRPAGWQWVTIPNLPPGLQTVWALPVSRTGAARGAAYQLTATVT